MREIKFRALLCKTGELPRWVFYTTNEIAYVDDGSWDAVKAKDSQYTGLKDKNGKEIYEGDIVLFQITDKYDHKTQVTWQEYGAWDYGLGKPEEIEVIGNVYESPELIKTT